MAGQRRRYLLVLFLTLLGLSALTSLCGQRHAERHPPEGSPKFEVGDHIYINRGGYDHHGIVYATDGTGAGIIVQVVHIASPRGDLEDMASNTFVVTGLDRFLRGSPYQAVKRMHYGAAWTESIWDVHASPLLPDPPAVVMARVEWLFRHRDDGLRHYDLLGQNCEHAAHWCRTGQQWSRQSLVALPDAAPFSAREDPVLAANIARLGQLSLRRIPQPGATLHLRLESGGAALGLINGGPELGLVPEGSALFRIHSQIVKVAQDSRYHTVLGFEWLGRGCFLGGSKGRLVCISPEFGRSEWFVAHESGTLQHFESGGFLVGAPGGIGLRQSEEAAVVFRWPNALRLRTWSLRMVSMLCCVGLLAIACSSRVWQNVQAVEALMHILLVALLLVSGVMLWMNGEVVAFTLLFAALLVGLPVGQRRAAPHWIAPVVTLAVCAILGGLILWRAHAYEEPMFTAAAHALLVSLLILVIVDLILAMVACCHKMTGPPSRTLAVLAIPVLLIGVVSVLSAGRAVPSVAILVQGATAAVGIARVAWVGRLGPRRQMRRAVFQEGSNV